MGVTEEGHNSGSYDHRWLAGPQIDCHDACFGVRAGLISRTGSVMQEALDAVGAAVRNLPRVRLGTLPTPLEEAPRLSESLGRVRILIKRDDLTGLALGGNKTRMFEFVIAKAIATGANAVVGGAAVQSNYARQLAASCARVGLDCHLVLRRLRGHLDDEPQAALLLDLILGAHVYLVDDDRAGQHAAMQQLVQELESKGCKVYQALMASEADKALHSVAYVDAAAELVEQLVARGIHVDHIYVCSLDATHAGLRLGLKNLGSRIHLLAISPNEASLWPDRSIEDEVARLANEAASLLGLQTRLKVSEVEQTTAYVGERYGAVTSGGVEAIRLFGATEGVLLDPVYTAKAAAALIDHIRVGILREGETVVFWHTGGQPALFAYANAMGFDTPPRFEMRV